MILVFQQEQQLRMVLETQTLSSTAHLALYERRIRVVALADSLSLPRGTESHEEIVRWEDTWPTQLEILLCRRGLRVEVINCGARDRTAEALSGAEFYEHFRLKRPDIAVIQLGVADCAPRIFSRFEKRLLNSRIVPAPFREWIIRHRSSRRARITRRNPLAKVHVPPTRFKSLLTTFAGEIDTLTEKPHILFVPIAGDADKMEQKSPGFSDNLQIYNEIIREFTDRTGFGWLKWNPTQDCFWDDGYHLSVAGNRRLAAALTEKLTPYLSSADAGQKTS